MVVDFFLREYGYNITDLMRDIEDHPEMIGELLELNVERNLQQDRKSGKGKLSESDLEDNVAMAEWAGGRGQESRGNLAGADAALAARGIR